MNTPDLVDLLDRHPAAAAVTALSAVALLTLAAWAARRLFQRRAGAENTLTMVAAGIATAVASQGMWNFFGDVLHFSGPLRVLTFAFIEVAVVTSAVRARASMSENDSAGVDGVAVWVLTSLSAILSSLDAHSPGEVVLRLTAPLVAAWLWERGMTLERRRRTGRARINWRLTPERVLIRLGLADPTDRTASQVDAQRRILRLAIAAKRARAASGRRRVRALKRLDRAMEGAVEYGGLGTSPDSQTMLTATLGALVNASELLDLRPPAPWGLRTVVRTPVEMVSEGPDSVSETEPRNDPAAEDFRHPQTPSDSGVRPGESTTHDLDEAIRSAKADGLSVRAIADAYEITKYRVEKALTADSDSDTSDDVSEVSEIPAPMVATALPLPVLHANGCLPTRPLGDLS